MTTTASHVAGVLLLGFLCTFSLGGIAPRKKSVADLPPTSERWALIVGIGKYEDPELNQLFGPNDANTLANDLKKYAGFPDDQVIVLSDNESSERQPRRERILYWLSNIKRNASSKSLLLFAFSGHGISLGPGDTFLLAIDTHISYDKTYLTQNAISSEDVAQSLHDSRARQVILLLDACRNNPYGTKGPTSNALTQSFADAFDFDKVNIGKEAYATLYATSIGSEAFQYHEAKMGYFTYVLDQAFQNQPYRGERAYDSEGRMTLASLIKYVEDRTPALVRINHPDKSQIPYAKTEGYMVDEVLLARRRDLPDKAADSNRRKEPSPPSSTSVPRAPVIQQLPQSLTSSETTTLTVKADVTFTSARLPDGTQIYDVRIWLQGPEDVLQRIQSVSYTFPHASFHPNPKMGTDRNHGFEIRYKGWGCVSDIRVEAKTSAHDTSPAVLNLDLCSYWPA